MNIYELRKIACFWSKAGSWASIESMMILNIILFPTCIQSMLVTCLSIAYPYSLGSCVVFLRPLAVPLMICSAGLNFKCFWCEEVPRKLFKTATGLEIWLQILRNGKTIKNDKRRNIHSTLWCWPWPEHSDQNPKRMPAKTFHTERIWVYGLYRILKYRAILWRIVTASLLASYQTTRSTSTRASVAPKRSPAPAWMEQRWTKAEQQVDRLTHGVLDQYPLSLQFINSWCHLSLSLSLDLHLCNCWTKAHRKVVGVRTFSLQYNNPSSSPSTLAT